VILLLLGAPGSGKGTQGRRLSEHFRIPYLASGDLLRRAIDQHSELGERVKQYVERGLYVPDEVMVPAAMAELQALRAEWGTNGVVLDGFPRTREQAAALDKALVADGTRVQRVLFLTVPKDILMSRLAGRWTCRNCGASYNVHTHPPRVPGRCDRCGHELSQRVDDRAEMVERRLTVYLESTVPLVAYYRQQGVMVEVDGNRGEVDVTAALVAAAEGRDAATAAIPV
jgi:adenylate kinase